MTNLAILNNRVGTLLAELAASELPELDTELLTALDAALAALAAYDRSKG